MGDGYLIFEIPAGFRVHVFEKKIQSEGTAGSGVLKNFQRMVGFHERTGKDSGDDYFRFTFDFFSK